jgi:hypothetical protein
MSIRKDMISVIARPEAAAIQFGKAKPLMTGLLRRLRLLAMTTVTELV